jgi:hypothetical protein
LQPESAADDQAEDRGEREHADAADLDAEEDQYVAMFTVDSPVTQMTDTAVNNASTSGAPWPDEVEIGRENNRVKTSTRAAKTTIANRAGVAAMKDSTASRSRTQRLSRSTGLPTIVMPASPRALCSEQLVMVPAAGPH